MGNVFAFLVKPGKGTFGENDGVQLVFAKDFEEAEKRLSFRWENGKREFTYKCCGFFTPEQMAEALSPERMDPILSSAALRYAAAEYEEILTTAERRSLNSSARKIINIFFQSNESDD